MLLSIYDIFVHKKNKYHVKNHFISASSFCVVMKKAESVSTVLSLPYFYSIYKQQIFLFFFIFFIFLF